MSFCLILIEKLKKNILFICSQNKLRSPTAEQIYSTREDLNVLSAGLNNDAENPVSVDLLTWADSIYVMEKAHLNRLRKKFGEYLKNQKLVSLDIPDIYEFMEPSLIEELAKKLRRFIGNPND
ncbi:MAG: protein tyrosine phosphatase [Balneola sp.]|nr:MAG: protein tyrosine phosphatase [Balneola sp.]